MKLYVERETSPRIFMGEFGSFESAEDYVNLNEDYYEGFDWILEDDVSEYFYTDSWEEM